MEKSNTTQKGISFVLDTRQLTEKTNTFSLTATPKEREDLAQWFDLPQINSLQVNISTYKKEDVIHVDGYLTADVIRECVVSGDEFTQKTMGDFNLLFSTSQQTQSEDIDMEEEIIEFLPRGQIYFKEIITEQFGLFLDPFPKNTTDFFEYRENDAETVKENPFTVLKGLTKS